MKNKYFLLSFFMIIINNIYSQDLNQRFNIVKDYDFAKYGVFKKDIESFYKNQSVDMQLFLKRNPTIKESYEFNGVLYKIDHLNEDGMPVYISTSNYNAGRSTRANRLYSGGTLGLNIQGQNMIAGVWEIGSMNASHNHFQSRSLQKDGSVAAHSDHATHVTGTIIQNGGTTLSRGMAFNGNVWANDITNEFTEMVDQAYEGLLISNHSYGINFLNSATPPVLQVPIATAGKYNDHSRVIDVIHNLAPNYLAVFAAGNERGSQGSVTNKGGYDMLSFRSVSKNALVVGAVDDVTTYTNAASVVMSSFSNWGPVDDGRIKPDIVGNGVSVRSTTGDAVGSTSTSVFDGTSMAAPNVTGTMLLLQQHYNNINGKFLSAAGLKGLSLHTADEAGTATGPDYRFGWGLLNAEAGARLVSNTGLKSDIFELTLNPGETKVFSYTAESAAIPLMASISWNDPAGVVNTAGADDATPALVRDLDIRVEKSSVITLPWKLNPASPAAAATKGDNVVDPFEKIQVDSPSGMYNITISHKGTITDAQKVTFVISGITSPFTVRSSEVAKNVCTNQSVAFNFNYLSNANPSPTTFTVLGLPAGVTSSFLNPSMNADGSNTLTLNNFNSVAPGVYSFQINASNGSISKTLNFEVNVYSSTFVPSTGFVPADNAVDVPIYTNITWDQDVNAQQYTVQIATDLAFSNIVQSQTVQTNSYVSSQLNVNTDYYWRVSKTNLCSVSSYSQPLRFKTVNLECSSATNNTVKPIAEAANTVVTSVLNFNNPSITSIYDLDVNLNLTHTYVQDMTLKLTSPQGTTLILQQEACGNQDNINVVYDDNGAAITCSSTPPAISGRVKSFQVLSAFNGQNPNGDWTLEVNDPYNGDGGNLQSWGLNICKQVVLSSDSFNLFNSISVSPNPTSSVLFYEIPNDLSNININLFDITGKKMNVSNNELNKTLDLSNLEVGVYFVKFYNEQYSTVKKVIKK